MSPRAEIIYLLIRSELQQERTVEILLGLQARLNEAQRMDRPPWWNGITVSDVIKVSTAGALLWLTITGKITPADVVGLLK